MIQFVQLCFKEWCEENERDDDQLLKSKEKPDNTHTHTHNFNYSEERRIPSLPY